MCQMTGAKTLRRPSSGRHEGSGHPVILETRVTGHGAAGALSLQQRPRRDDAWQDSSPGLVTSARRLSLNSTDSEQQK